MVKADMIEEESTEDMVAYRAGMWRFHNVIASLKGEMKFTSSEMRELSKTSYDFGRMKEMIEGGKNMSKHYRLGEQRNLRMFESETGLDVRGVKVVDSSKATIDVDFEVPAIVRNV